jgi:hypothetical protein
MTSDPQDPIRDVPVTEIIAPDLLGIGSLSRPSTGTELDPAGVALVNPDLRGLNDQ